MKTEKVQLMRKKKRCSVEAILKAAKYCARRFNKESEQINDQHFLRYCNKKINKLLRKETLPNIENCESILSILNVYDNIYYKTEESQGHSQRNEDQSEENEYQNCHTEEEKVEDHDQNSQTCDQNHEDQCQ